MHFSMWAVYHGIWNDTSDERAQIMSALVSNLEQLRGIHRGLLISEVSQMYATAWVVMVCSASPDDTDGM